MPKKITQVRWTASEIPSGLSFNESTGTFSGTPSNAGEYTVPVTVETNYGTDTKDVIVGVEGRAYPVYAIGSKASTWSDSTGLDANGFYKLDMPDAYKLSTVYEGFAGKTAGNNWYVAGNVWSYLTDKHPVKLDEEGVQEITGGLYRGTAGTNFYIALGKKAGSAVSWTSNAYTYPTYSIKHDSDMHIKKLQSSFSSGLCFISEDNRIFATSSGSNSSDANYGGETPENVKTISSIAAQNKCYVLTGAGELWKLNQDERDQLGAELGAIHEMWPCAAGGGGATDTLFVLIDSNKLYAKGLNGSTYGGPHKLGLPEATTYTDFTLVGEYEVKRIETWSTCSFMLTVDGKLYHTGAAVSGITEAHTGFTQIYPDYKFVDIAYTNGAKTLVVTRE